MQFGAPYYPLRASKEHVVQNDPETIGETMQRKISKKKFFLMVSWGVFCFWAISKMTRLGDMAFLPYPKCYNSAGWCKMSLNQKLGQSKRISKIRFGAFLPNFGRFGAIF